MSAVNLEVSYRLPHSPELLDLDDASFPIQGTFTQAGSSWPNGRGDVEKVAVFHLSVMETLLQEPKFYAVAQQALNYHLENTSKIFITDRVILDNQPNAESCKVLWHSSSYDCGPSTSSKDLAWIILLEGAAALTYAKDGRYINTLKSGHPDREVWKELGLLSRRAHMMAVLIQAASDKILPKILGNRICFNLQKEHTKGDESRLRSGKSFQDVAYSLSSSELKETLLDKTVERLFDSIEWSDGITAPHITSARIQSSSHDRRNSFLVSISHFSSIGERTRRLELTTPKRLVPSHVTLGTLKENAAESLRKKHETFVATLRKHLHFLLDVVDSETQKNILECLVSAGELHSAEVTPQRLWLVGNTLESVIHLGLLVTQRPVASQPLIRLSNNNVRFGDFFDLTDELGIEVKMGGDPQGIENALGTVLPAVGKYELIHLIGEYQSLSQEKLAIYRVQDILQFKEAAGIDEGTSVLISLLCEVVQFISEYRTSEDANYDEKLAFIQNAVEAIILRRHSISDPAEAVATLKRASEDSLLSACLNTNAAEENVILQAVLQGRYDAASRILGSPLEEWRFPRGLYYDQTSKEFRPKTDVIPTEAINLLRELRAQKMVQIVHFAKKNQGRMGKLGDCKAT